MEIALIIYMCSAIQNTCLDPYIWPETFYDNYGCMIQGYKEGEKKIAEIGRKDVNKYDLYIKFNCQEFKVIIPPPKPKPETQSKVVI